MVVKLDWLINEADSAGRENMDVDHVSRYDVKEDAGADAEVALLKTFGLQRQSEVVDIGAGTGQFSVTAAEVCARVIAVDVSPVMIERLKSKIRELGLSNVEIMQAGFLTYKHRDKPADFVYSRLALHHLPDFWKAMALERIHRIMRPGGILRLWDVIYDFNPEEAEERIEAWCASFEGNHQDEWSRSELAEHVRDEHSTFRWLFEPMLERCGFEIQQVEYSSNRFFGGYVARAV